MIKLKLDSRFKGIGVLVALIALLFYFTLFYTFSFAVPADCDADIGTEGDLNTAISCFNGETGPGTTTLTFTADISLTSSSTAISNTTGAELQINGADFTIDGQNTSGIRPLEIMTNTVVRIDSLIVTNGNTNGLEEDGGGIRNYGNLSISNSQVISNTSSDDGGGIYNGRSASLSLDTVIVADNSAADDGGGVQNINTISPLTIVDSFILRNNATLLSGGIGTLSPTTIERTEISGNTAGQDGAGVYNNATVLTITDSSISDNTATRDGGGLFSEGAAVSNIYNSTLDGNQSTNGGGGAVYLQSTSSGSLENVTITANVSDDGAIANTGSLTLTHATIVNNLGAHGLDTSGTVKLINSILSDNATSDCSKTGAGSIDTSGSINLLNTDDPTDSCNATGVITGSSNLLALADNGGFGETMMPDTGSAAINAGTNSCSSSDQRGIARSTPCELGAVEIVSISIADASVAEGTGSTQTISFTLTRTDASVPMSVTVNTTDDTAAAGSDYTAVVNQVVGFADGETTQEVAVSVTTDNELEADETFTVTLSSPVNAALADAVAVGTITNDDLATVTLSSAAAIDEGDAGTSTYVFTATLDVAVSGGFDIAISAADGTATTADNDYSATAGTLTFAGNAAEIQTFNVTVNGDEITEMDETFTVSLGAVTHPTLSGAISTDNSPATGTITNDDTAEFEIEVGTNTVGEAAGTLPVTVTLSNAAAFTTTVNYATSDGTATAGADYDADSDTLTFGPSETSKTFDITINDDTGDEPDESFDITLSGASGASLGTTISQTVNIIDDDGAPTIQLGSTTYNVGEEEGSLDVVVSLSNSSSSTISVTVQSGDISATAGVDYDAVNSPLVFAAGEISKTVSIAISNDTIYEGDELFSLTLTDEENVTLGINTAAVVTITEDETAPVLSIADTSGLESSGSLTFTVSLSSPSAVTVTVNYATQDGTASSASGDFDSTSGTLTIAPGETSGTVSIMINNDELTEGSESFALLLSDPTGATLDPSPSGQSGTATILDDESNMFTIFLPIIIK